MQVIVKDRKHKELGKFAVSQNMKIKDFKELYAREAKVKKMDVNRQWYNLNDIKGTALSDNTKTLKDYGVNDGDTFYLKDLGLQISWKFVFLAEYFGPIAIFVLFYYCRKWIYSGVTDAPLSFTQKA